MNIATLSPQERRALLERLLLQQNGTGPAPREAPASFAQERLWFLDRLQPGMPLYNIPVPLRLAGYVDPGTLERALNEVVRRHEVLRTTFQARDGGPVQVVAPAMHVPLALVDLAFAPPGVRQAEAARLAAEDAARPFDLERGPLLRATLVRLEPLDFVLLICMHHIVSDGWSVSVLLRELSVLTAAFAQGQPSPLPPLPLQYADYAREQRERLSGPALERLLGWWRDRVAGAPTLLELPTDRPRPPEQSFRGGTHAFGVDEQTGRGVRTLARAEGATPFMVLLAAFGTLLSRYAGADDVLVGSPIAGRTRVELEGMIGFFVNTLVLRVETGGGPSFRELVRRVRESTLGAFTHQDLPFERLVEELQPERSLAHNPLFQVAFTYQNLPNAAGQERAPAAAAPDPAPPAPHAPGAAAPAQGTAKFDLMLYVADQGDAFAAGLEYNADLFDPATVARITEHFTTLLRAAVADPAARADRLSLLAPAERARLAAWNGTEWPLPEVEGVHRLIEAQAARTPERPAVVDDEGTLTYREVNERANRLARHLRALGVGPESPVGVCLERTADLPVAVLAVLKAGGAYLPLDPRNPAERLDFMLRDAGARVAVTRGALERLLPAEGVAKVCLERDASAIAAREATDLAGGAGPANLAYVIYTSGSVGRPKGTMVEHGTFLNLILWWIDTSPITPASRCLLMVSIGFDASIKNFVAPLVVGAQAVLTAAELADVPALLKVIRSRGVTAFTCTPSLLNPLVEGAAAGGYAALETLEHVMVGGEPVTTAALRPWLSRPGARCTIVNVYGPTECTDLSATHHAGPAEVCAVSVVPIGRPVHNARLYVVDRRGEPLPAGVPGELWVAGGNLSRGYLGRPALTAERFVPAPQLGEPRVYRTGDRVRLRPDGVLEFLGRMDDQVKIRGARVEPGEVESVLSGHPAVHEAVVVARTGEAGHPVLVAYVVPRAGSGEEASGPALSAWLRDRLPEPLVPSAWVRMDEFPLSPNGKVDRRALPAPTGAGAGAAFVAPRTSLEEVLARIWTEVLRVERVGVEDNFFDLGGHSLLATQVVSRVRDTLRVELPLRDIFGAPTVAALARALDGGGEAGERLEQAAGLVLQLERMSDEEVQAALGSRGGAGNGAAP